MWLIFLEAGVALCLLLLIVWASWPKQKKPVPLRHGGGEAKHGKNAEDAHER